MKKYILKLWIFSVIMLLNHIAGAQAPCPPKSLEKITSPDSTILIIEPSIIGTNDDIVTFEDEDEDPNQPSSVLEHKMVYWVHGMNGNDGSWEKASTATESQIQGLEALFPARKAYGHSIDYSNTQTTIKSAAINSKSKFVVSGVLSNSGYDESRSLAIAHSQGGIVMRELDWHFTHEAPDFRKFGALATFGSPHQGAIGLDGVQEKGKEFMRKASNDLIALPISLIADHQKWHVRAIAKVLNIEKWEKTTEIIASEIGGIILNNEISPMSSELVVGSDPILQLNSTERHTPIPMIPYFGTLEDYDVIIDEAPMRVEVIWSVLKFMVDSPNSPDYFAAKDSEHELQVSMNRAKQYYVNHANEAQREVDKYSKRLNRCWRLILPTAVGACILINDDNKQAAINRRNAALRGKRWFYTVNHQWKVLIGARELSMVCRCEHSEYFGADNRWDTWWTEELITDPSQCNSSEFFWTDGIDSYSVNCHVVNNAFSHWVEHESDGLVLKKSAMGIPAHFMPNGVIPLELKGSSHFGMRNDENLMHRLNELYNGDISPAFRLEPLNN